jgi:hypothetical protein
MMEKTTCEGSSTPPTPRRPKISRLQNTETQKNEVDMALKHSHEYRTYDRASRNTEPDREQIHPSLRVARLVHGIHLNNPEDDAGDVIDPRRQAQQQHRREHLLMLRQRPREHRIGRTEVLPGPETHDEEEPDRQRRDDLRGAPRERLPAPIDADEEYDDAGDGEEAAQVVDAGEDLPLG